MTGQLAEFLTRMSNIPVTSLPLVHTTPAYNLRRIFHEKKILTSQCQVFNEQLCYFFFGRPAYKWDTEGDAADWELPVCFVFEYDISEAKRVFPFDTGAYRTDRMPSFLKMMPLEEFEIGKVTDSPSKVVGAYFNSVSDYFNARCKAEGDFREQFNVEDIESEVRALHRLYANPSTRIDDRRATVEVQFPDNVDLEKRKLIALILPDIYLSNSAISTFCKKGSVTLLPYDAFPLNSAAYTALIYHKLKDFYQSKGFIRR